MRSAPSAGRSTTIAISGIPSPSTSGVANGSHPVGQARGPPLASAFPSPSMSTARTSVAVPRVGQPPTSLIFVTTETESRVPLPSKSPDMLRTSHTGNPRPRSFGAGDVGEALGTGVTEPPTSVEPPRNASERKTKPPIVPESTRTTSPTACTRLSTCRRARRRSTRSKTPAGAAGRAARSSSLVRRSSKRDMIVRLLDLLPSTAANACRARNNDVFTVPSFSSSVRAISATFRPR